jgi:rhamnogalacturonyl hydrolase YesR
MTLSRFFAPALLTLCLVPAAAAPLPDPAQVLAALERANGAQIAAFRATPVPLQPAMAVDRVTDNWVGAAYYVGAARLARVSADPATLQFLTEVADHFNYALRGAASPREMLNADDMAIGDLYEELFARRRQPGVLMPLRQRADFALPFLAREPAPQRLVWWWSDALFMAPPVLARLSALTGDPSYLQAMDVQWWRNVDRLYDRNLHLMLRDERFLTRRDDSGRKIVWSRGDGWVMAGTARVLESMPADFSSRPRYIALFKDMAARIVRLQRPDGLWPASLLDPAAFPEGETSGTAFYTYAFAWGINHGILDRRKYLPAVLKGWAALNAHLLPNGLLGLVQKTGDQPVTTRPEDTGPYAQGAFLLAGLEVINLGKPVAGLPLAEPAPDSPAMIAATMPRWVRPVTVQGQSETQRHSREMSAVTALGFDPQADDTAVIYPRRLGSLPPPPQTAAAAIVRYAPYRYDDILWENDRIAHRLYGPALEAFEPPSGSGIDIWGKHVRYPFMERQLASGNQHDYQGEGLDYYNVGQSRGVGGIGIWFDNKLWVSRNYLHYTIINPGPVEARFSLDYAPWPVGTARSVSEHRELSLPLGTNFTRQISTISSNDPSPLIVGIGIARHATSDQPATYRWDAATGRLTVWEKTDPDKGTMGAALMVDPAMVAGFTQDADNYLVLVRVTPATPFVYYSGGCWDKGPDFHSRAEWERYVAAQTPVFQ